MLRPKKTKFRTAHKGYIRVLEQRSTKIFFGWYGLKAIEPGLITSKQIEATRRAMIRKIKKSGKIWIRAYPDIPVTSKPVEVRMGKGKGTVDHFVCRVKPGKILFEINGVSLKLAKELLRKGSMKLPLRTKFVQKK